MDMNFEKCEWKQREKDIENILFLLDVAEMKYIEMFVGTAINRTAQAIDIIFKKDIDLSIEVITAIKKAVEEWEKKN